MKIKKRHIATLLVVSLLALLLLQFNWHAVLGQPLVISRQTTFITEPVREDGGIDYLAAYNRELMVSGVTVETNAFIDLLRVLPSSIEHPLEREQFAKQLGLSAFPEEFQYIDIPSDFHVKRYGRSSDGKAWRAEWTHVLNQPWTSQDYPKWGAWVEEYDEAIDFLVAASRKSHFYYPMVVSEYRNEESLSREPFWEFRHRQAYALILSCRAMNSLGEKNGEAALEDVLALYRWSRLHGQSLSIAELCIHGSHQFAFSSAQTLIRHGNLNEEQLQRFQSTLAGLPEGKDLAARIDRGERLITLADLQDMNLKNLSISDWVSRGDAVPSSWPTGIWMDWNAAMAEVNRLFDQGVEALREETTDKRRIERVAELDEEQDAWIDQVWMKHLLSLTGAQTRGRLLARNLAMLYAPWDDGLLALEVTHKVQMDLVQLGIALEQFRLAKGQYPERLEELVPQWIEVLPIDRFTDAALKYHTIEDSYVIYSVGRDSIDNGGAEDFDVVFFIDRTK